jgi:hypothetical protein
MSRISTSYVGWMPLLESEGSYPLDLAKTVGLMRRAAGRSWVKEGVYKWGTK